MKFHSYSKIPGTVQQLMKTPHGKPQQNGFVSSLILLLERVVMCGNLLFQRH